MDAEGADHSAPFDAPAQQQVTPQAVIAPQKSAMAAAVGDDEMF